MNTKQLADRIDFLGKQLAYYDLKSLDSFRSRDLQNHRDYREKALELERQAAQALSAYYAKTYLEPQQAPFATASQMGGLSNQAASLPFQLTC